MIEVRLTKGHVALIDDEDAHLNEYKWCASVARRGVYAVRKRRRADGPGGSLVLLHRVIVDAPIGLEVDHIDGDTLNNRRGNLRVVSRAENSWNAGQYKNNTSGHRGVWWSAANSSWRAGIEVQLNGKRKTLYFGYHSTIDAAVEARLKAERELWGIQPRRAAAHAEMGV